MEVGWNLAASAALAGVHDCIAHAYNCAKTQGMLNMIQGMLNMVFDVGTSIREKGDGKTFVYGDA